MLLPSSGSCSSSRYELDCCNLVLLGANAKLTMSMFLVLLDCSFIAVSISRGFDFSTLILRLDGL